VVVVMDHANKHGQSKVLRECTLPLTGIACVDLVITTMGVFEVERGKGLTLVELAPDVSLEEIQAATEAKFLVAESLGRVSV
jgi:3-oxoacid CoA-transferase B subunit